MTLVETLVAATLTLLVLGLVFGYLIPASKVAYRYQLRSQMQQTALVVFDKIAQSAASTSPGGLSWSRTEIQALAFNAHDELQPGNAVLRWTDDFQVFWWNPAQEVLQNMEWPYASGQATTDESTVIRAKRLDPFRLREVITLYGSDRNRILARNVSNFSVQHDGPEGALIQPVKVTLSLSQSLSNQKIQVDQSFTFRVSSQQ
jgi:hypothetical protein